MAKKRVTSPRLKERSSMTTETATLDDLAALGIGDLTGAPVEAPKTVTPTEAVDTVKVVSDVPAAADAEEDKNVAKKPQTREAVDVGDIEIEEDVAITPLTRSSGGSKYKFAELRAPVKKDDGSYSYASFKVENPEGQDVKKLQRSVQSATVQANAKHKDKKDGFEGHDTYFITRSINENGKAVGIRVFRVDGTIAKED